MSHPLEHYALIGDTRTAALVGLNGSIDWLCLQRFDSGACFAGILGGSDHGRWQITPLEPTLSVRRRYRGHSLVLETELTTATGTARLVDFMPVDQPGPRVLRIVEGIRGCVAMSTELRLRFDYGRTVPWVHRVDHELLAVAGLSAVTFRADARTEGHDLATPSRFEIASGQQLSFDLAFRHSTDPAPPPISAVSALADTETWWQTWASQCTYSGRWQEDVMRSLLILRALTGASGGIVAAPTTSLPEVLGGVRNWDYRFCWLRDATSTLYALLSSGYRDEARRWRDWLLRAVAGHPSQLQVLYGLDGERLLPEVELGWLPGYESSGPVRIGNAAVAQRQLAVYGEVMDVLYAATRFGLEPEDEAWQLQVALMEYLEGIWDGPDEGIWEVRGPPRLFTHSKVMAWVAFDRAVKAIETSAVEGPVERWRTQRDLIHAEVCRHGFDPTIGAFVQYYGSEHLDASALLIPLVGFLPPEDRRVQGTVAAIERDLVRDGLVRRYLPDAAVDGLPEHEAAFLACSFWLVDNLVLANRHESASEFFGRLLELRNDVGLLAEEYDPTTQRLVGNYPQAFSHVALVNSALNLTREHGPAHHRRTA